MTAGRLKKAQEYHQVKIIEQKEDEEHGHDFTDPNAR